MKTFLTIFLLFFSTSVVGEWTEITRLEDGRAIYFIDFNTIKKINGKIIVWELVDYPYKLPGIDVDIYSAKNLQLMDCNMMKTKYLTSIYYDSLYGEGSVVYTNDAPVDKWYYQAPGSAGYSIVTKACSK